MKLTGKKLNLIGSELISVIDIEKGISPSDEVVLEIKYASGDIKRLKTLCIGFIFDFILFIQLVAPVFTSIE